MSASIIHVDKHIADVTNERKMQKLEAPHSSAGSCVSASMGVIELLKQKLH